MPVSLETTQILDLGRELFQLLPPSSSQPSISTLEMDVDMAKSIDTNSEEGDSEESMYLILPPYF